MKNIIQHTLLLCIIIASYNSKAQNKFFVKFTDKNNTGFSIENPSEFLSERAISRRAKQSIQITEQDLPVNTNYVKEINETGAKVDYALKWFNGVVVTITDNYQISTIQNLTFVDSTIKIFEFGIKGSELSTDIESASRKKTSNTSSAMFNYGNSYTQIKMSNGQSFHNNGFLGDGIQIAVIDAGFLNVDTHPVFDSLRTQGRILGTKDFINPKSNIYQEHSHGMMVLSTMGGYIGGQLIGTAPQAKYWLIRTENANVEQVYEEYAWAAGAEFADSVGVDIINTSLGYTTFDVNSQNHSYEDLDGNTTTITKAANIASSKGIAVVVSAGNDGNAPWHYISAPADSPHVLTIGAVDRYGEKASFSSFGPTSDGRIKPDVCAMGQASVVATANGLVGTANGTSFSSPIMAGMLACLWQSKPGLSSTELIQLVKTNSSLANTPNNSLGYGIPDFSLLSNIHNTTTRFTTVNISPNPFSKDFNLLLSGCEEGLVEYSIISMIGTTLVESRKRVTNSQLEINVPSSIPTGSYIVRINTGSMVYFAKAIKI